MKDPESLPDLLNPINDFSSGATISMEQRCFKKLLLISRKFSMRSTHRWTYAVIQACRHLTEDKKSQLHALLKQYKYLFNGTLGTWNNKPYHIELKEGAKPYHSRPCPVPKICEHTLNIELNRLVKLGVLK